MQKENIYKRIGNNIGIDKILLTDQFSTAD